MNSKQKKQTVPKRSSQVRPHDASKVWLDHKKSIFQVVALIIITFIVYINSIGNSFVLIDDVNKIFNNPLIAELNWVSIQKMFSTYIYHSYSPLLVLSYSLDYAIWGGYMAHGFHATNLFLHICNVVLLYFFVLKLYQKNNAAFIAALIFAVHPMNVETVAWISERSNVLYTLFFLSAMISYLHGKTSPQKIKFTVLTFVFFLFSALAKPTAVTLPLVLILIDYFITNSISVKSIIHKIPYFLISLLFGIIAIMGTAGDSNIKDLSATYTIFDRIFIVFYPLTVYIFKFFAPLNLSVIYGYPLKTAGFLPLSYYLSIIPLLLILFITVRYKPLKKYLTFSFLFFLFNISTLLMIIPVGGDFLMAEHFVYIPYIGFAIIAGMIFSKIIDKTIPSSIPAPVLLSIYFIVLPLFCIATYNRNHVWKNSDALFTDLVKQKPENAYAHYSLGTLYLEKKQYEKAIQEFNFSIRLDSSNDEAYYNRAISRSYISDNDSSLIDFNMTLTLNPSFDMAYVNRGSLKAKTGDTLAAIEDFTKAINTNATNKLAYFNRGNLEMNTKYYTAAMNDYNKAISIDPKYADAYNNRGINKYFMKDYTGSIDDYNAVLKIDKKNKNAFKNRGLSKLALADTTGACEDFNAALSAGLTEANKLIRKYCR